MRGSKKEFGLKDMLVELDGEMEVEMGRWERRWGDGREDGEMGEEMGRWERRWGDWKGDGEMGEEMGRWERRWGDGRGGDARYRPPCSQRLRPLLPLFITACNLRLHAIFIAPFKNNLFIYFLLIFFQL